jgi:hypothetical protein
MMMTHVNVMVMAAAVMWSAAEQPAGPMAGGWEGLIHKEVLDTLDDRRTVKIDGVSFAYGVIPDAKTFAALDKVAVARPHNKVHNWDAWWKNTDWDKHVVVYVVRTEATNLLKLDGYHCSKQGVPTVRLQFSSIEPFYGQHYPVVLYRLNRGEGQKAQIDISMQGDRGDFVPLVTLPLERISDSK